MYDADDKGWEGAQKLRKEVKWEAIDTRGLFGTGFDPQKKKKITIKDFAELRLCKGERAVIEILNKLI